MKNEGIKENNKYSNNQDINKRTQIEKELNIQRNQKNKNKGPNLSDIKMNQLNYYNEIAKHNIHNLMNNPSLKDIVRITSNESVFDLLQAKELSKDKDLSKFLDVLPLKRVERINYKCLEIGHMRKDLGLIRNPKPTFNKEKCKEFAGNLFEKRKKKGSVNYIPVLTIDNLNQYNQNFRKSYQKPENNDGSNVKKNLVVSNEETWHKKYKHNTHNANRPIFKIKKENMLENDRYSKETADIKSIKENKMNANLESARIQVKNKYKQNFEIENNVDKDIIEPSLYDNNIKTHKKSLTNSFSDNNNFNFNLKKEDEVTQETKENLQNEKHLNEKSNEFNFFSRDFSNNTTIPEPIKKNKNIINVKRSFPKNNENERINVRKNEELFNKNYDKKNLNKNNQGHRSQPFIRFKVIKG